MCRDRIRVGTDDKLCPDGDLDNGDKVDYSVLVLASGTTYEGPFSIPDTKSGAVAFITSWRERFAKANDIVLVGGGAVGLGRLVNYSDGGEDC